MMHCSDQICCKALERDAGYFLHSSCATHEPNECGGQDLRSIRLTVIASGAPS